jgi:hypothetical protein
MVPRFVTILTGSNLPKILQSKELEPSTLNERKVAGFARVVEQTEGGRRPIRRPIYSRNPETVLARTRQGFEISPDTIVRR